jgi:aldose 1-epimerase
VITLGSDDLRVVADPALGAALRGVSVRRSGGWWPLLRSGPEGSRWFNDAASYVLAPWCNRIEGGVLRWGGREVQLTPDWPDGSAIHGLVKDAAFEVEQRSPVSVVLRRRWAAGEGSWPWAFVCRVRYEVVGARFAVAVEVVREAAGAGVPGRGPGDAEGTMPAGVGFHPFFPRTLWDAADRVELKRRGLRPLRPCTTRGDEAAPAPPADDFDAGAPLTTSPLDHCFVGSLDGAELRWPASGVTLRMRCSRELGHAVIYTGGRDSGPLPFFCLEPVSMVPGGIALAEAGREAGTAGTGVVALAAGQTLRGEWGFEVVRA